MKKLLYIIVNSHAQCGSYFSSRSLSIDVQQLACWALDLDDRDDVDDAERCSMIASVVCSCSSSPTAVGGRPNMLQLCCAGSLPASTVWRWPNVAVKPCHIVQLFGLQNIYWHSCNAIMHIVSGVWGHAYWRRSAAQMLRVTEYSYKSLKVIRNDTLEYGMCSPY